MFRAVSIFAVCLGLILFSLAVLPKTHVQAKDLRQILETKVKPTATPRPTATPISRTCSPVNQTITTLPFIFPAPGGNGTGSFCWNTARTINSAVASMESMNVTSLTINGVNYTNAFVPRASLPPSIAGMWFIRYTSAVPWGVFRINAVPIP